MVYPRGFQCTAISGCLLRSLRLTCSCTSPPFFSFRLPRLTSPVTSCRCFILIVAPIALSVTYSKHVTLFLHPVFCGISYRVGALSKICGRSSSTAMAESDSESIPTPNDSNYDDGDDMEAGLDGTSSNNTNPLDKWCVSRLAPK